MTVHDLLLRWAAGALLSASMTDGNHIDFQQNNRLNDIPCMAILFLKALVNIVFDRFKKVKTGLADLYNYVHVGE